MSQREGSMGEGACYQAGWPEFKPEDHMVEKEK